MREFERSAATAISYLFHPLLMPLIGFLIINHSGTYAASLDHSLQRFISLVFFGLTFVLPIAFIPLYYYTRLIGSLKMQDRRDRIIPLYITLIFYLMAYLLIQKTQISRIYHNFMLASCLTVFLVLVVSFFWKISAHLSGLGGIVALIVVLSVFLKADLMLYLIIAVLIAGITAYARLRTDAHDPLQVYSGFLLGFGCVMLVFLI
ncbi:MAG: hypothetical protein JXB19_09910 [Bacteroidales bacterium]|nr:hypothetical protein [Bacteroidales bacterium]